MKLKALLLCFMAFASLTVVRAQDDDEPVRSHHSKPHVHYGKNVLSISPVTMTEIGVEGVGLSYEVALDKRGILAFDMPLVLAINNVQNNSYNGLSNNNATTSYGVFCAYPGIKIYPKGSFGVFRYAVGPNLVFESGNTGSYDGLGYWQTQSLSKFGVMVTNSFNINPSPKFYCGIDIGLGITYVYSIAGVSQTSDFLGRLAFSLGYRF